MPIAKQSSRRGVDHRSGTHAMAFGAAVLFASSIAFATTPARAEQTLKFATTVPLENPTNAVAWKPWVERVNKEAKGEFQIQIYGMSLANSRNVWERTVNGVTDIGFALHGTVGLSFDKTSVASLPLLISDGQAGAASVALWNLYEKGLLKDEYRNVRLLGLISLPVQGLTAKKPINQLSDIEGMKVRVADKISGDIASALGGSPISLSATEVYQALSRGVVDAAVANWIMMGAFRLTEVSSYYVTGVPLGAPPAFVVMNPKSYAGLSDKGKKILDKHVGEALSRHAGSALEKLAHGARSKILKSGDYKVSELDEAQAKKWEEALNDVVVKWSENTPNGKEVLKQFRAELEEATKAAK